MPADKQFTRTFVADKKVLQREAVGGSPALQLAAYIALGVIALIWIAAVAYGLRRLDRVERRGPSGGLTGGLVGRPASPRQQRVAKV